MTFEQNRAAIVRPRSLTVKQAKTSQHIDIAFKRPSGAITPSEFITIEQAQDLIAMLQDAIGKAERAARIDAEESKDRD